MNFFMNQPKSSIVMLNSFVNESLNVWFHFIQSKLEIFKHSKKTIAPLEFLTNGNY